MQIPFCALEEIILVYLCSIAGEESCWIVDSLEEVERLQGDNKYWCTECEHHVEAERSVEFHRVPEILTIQMKRFSAFSSWYVSRVWF